MALKFPVPLVEVIWHDASSDSGWETNTTANTSEELIVTIGFLITRGDSVVIISSSLDKETHSMNNSRMKIPIGMIKSVKELQVSYKKVKEEKQNEGG